MRIKYSIVIPTRNKCEYLSYAIQSVLESERNDIELIVSNNFSNDATSSMLSELKDPRLRVISPPLSLPMAGHYEFAVGEAKGEWVTILGDDDAVMPYIFDRLDYYIAEHSEIDIISSARAYYFWPGCKDLYGDVVVSFVSSRKAQVRSTKKDLIAVLAGLRSCFDMPQVYTTSIVKRSLFNEIKRDSRGYFYYSIIPDMYSAVALCLAREKYLRVDEPLFWVGTSNKSMGRSDRIYRDASEFVVQDEKQYKCVPKKISAYISYHLHSSGFSALYIYEGLLQCPLKSSWHDSKWIRLLVMSAVSCDTHKRAIDEKYVLTQSITADCHQYNIPMYVISFLMLILNILRVVIWLISLPKRALRRLGLRRSEITLHSKNRNQFPTIAAASAAVRKFYFSEPSVSTIEKIPIS